MAILHNPHTKHRILLQTLHAFGRRATSCRTVLTCPDVSQVHALARWNHARWEILDQSRNGTFLDGVRLVRDRWLPLTLGSELSMGDCPDAQWTVVDLGPPMNCIFPCDEPERAVELSASGVFLPPGAAPELHVHCLAGEWIAESPDGATTLVDGATLTIGGRPWELSLCPELTRTIESGRVPPSNLVLHFELSQDEEHARLVVQSETGAVDLGERIHHYSLATLARLRLQDARRGFDARSQGWLTTSELARMLGVDAAYVNIQVFRARQQFSEAVPEAEAAPLLGERRRGELRMGDYGFSVRRGAVLEGRMQRLASGELGLV